MRKLIISSFFILSLFILCSSFTKNFPGPYKNGDLIFIVNPSGQGRAIQLATKSKFTHIGIIFIENGKAMVYHAVEPVSKNTLEEFIGMSVGGRYEIKRLKDQNLLNNDILSKMLLEARAQLGKHYDMVFNWDDSELYCSEFVWKIYNHALNINIGALRPLKDFDLSHPLVKSTLTERYGKNIPLEENMISPGDMYGSELLE